MPAFPFPRLMATDRFCERRCRQAATALASAGRGAEAAWASCMAAFYAWRQARWMAIARGEKLPAPTLAEWTTTDAARANVQVQARFV